MQAVIGNDPFDAALTDGVTLLADFLSDDGGGAIRVELLRCDHHAQCKVIDQGAWTDGLEPGRGTEIAHALAARLGGSVTWSFSAEGTTATLTFECQSCLPGAASFRLGESRDDRVV